MTYKLYTKFLAISLFVFINNLGAQDLNSIYNSDNQNFTSDRYVTDEKGNIRMWVNIWGQVKNPGNYLVYNGTDIITLFAMAGGLDEGANLKEIKIFREFSDDNGKQVYIFNMDTFYETGDRNIFLPILPNDAYYVPQKTSSFLLSKVGVLNTVMSAINLYYLAMIRSEQVK